MVALIAGRPLLVRWLPSGRLAGLCVGLFVLFAASGLAAAQPADALAHAIQHAHLPDILVATGPTSPTDNADLSRALDAFKARSVPDDVSSLTAFLAQHPNSPWAPALLTNLGILYLHYGYFSKAIAAWQEAWAEGQAATDPRAVALIDRAAGSLALLDANLGRLHRLQTLLMELKGHPITGSATESVQSAAEELALVHRDARHLFNCGPIALRNLLLDAGRTQQQTLSLLMYHAGLQGTNLAQIAALAGDAKFAYRLIFREAGGSVPIPSIVHWKVGHFATIVGETNGRYHVRDPMLPGGSVWVTRGALDSEASGYFLVPAQAVGRRWRAVGTAEAATVWGKGSTTGSTPGGAGDTAAAGGGPGANPQPAPPQPPNFNPNTLPCNTGGGMCGYNMTSSSVAITLADTPVGYSPPIGPSVKVRISYNQREDSQPAVFNFFNVSPKWTLNWLSYVIDSPGVPGANVSRYMSGGGAYYYTGYNSTTGRFTAQYDDGSALVLVSQSPIEYERLLPDGSKEIYAQSDGSLSYPRKIFLSQVIDPQGNAVTLNYDSQMRLTSLTDAVGRQTTFTYGLSAQPLLVTAITDPFGRSAVLTYDSQGRLSSITDTIGITSSFTYDSNSLVDALTTPYGTTTFSYTAPGTSAPPRFAQATDPMGFSEREEWVEPAPIPDSDPAPSVPQGMPNGELNQYLSFRDTFYWDKNAYTLAGCTPSGGCNYGMARDQHFAHLASNTNDKSTEIDSIKYPAENRIWFNYPGGGGGNFTSGTFQRPIAVGRVLDNGATQLTQYAYDAANFYKLTQVIDPSGRTTNFTYPNGVDLAAVTQVATNGVPDTVAQYVYNPHHRPIAYVDAAGQVTSYTYNAAGQLTSVTNPLGQTTQYQYNATGDLTAIINADGKTAASFTYDAFDRVATYTDAGGWTASYSYDAADRITKITYPDGTSDRYTYDKLDLASHTDRLGRVWTYTHDADRRLTSITDPSGQVTRLGYNADGELTSLTDPKGNVTTWAYDGENRLVSQRYPDGSVRSWGYEATTSRLALTIDPLGQVTHYSYGVDNLLAGISYSNAVNATPPVAFTYDAFYKRVTSMTDGTGTTSYSYVPAGSLGALQVQQETQPTGASIAYGYDALGRLSSRTVTGSGPESFQYDALGRLVGHASDLGSFTLGYLGETAQLTSRALTGTTLATTWSYLPNSGDRRLAGIASVGLSSGQSSSFTYTSNDVGWLTSSTETSDAPTVYPSSGQQAGLVNKLNQLTVRNGQTLVYDADGHLLSDGVRSYSWDAAGRLIGILYPGQPGNSTSFTYDGLGRRVVIANTAGGNTTTIDYVVWISDDRGHSPVFLGEGRKPLKNSDDSAPAKRTSLPASCPSQAGRF